MWPHNGHTHGLMLCSVDASGELNGTLCGRQAVPCLVPAVNRTQPKSDPGDRRTYLDNGALSANLHILDSDE